jgi:integrase
MARLDRLCSFSLGRFGTDIRFVQVLLGHASIRSTMRYTHVSNAALAQIESPWDRLLKAQQQGGQPCKEPK